MIITASGLDALRVSFKQDFNRGWAAWTPTWNKIATQVPSATRENRYGWIRDFPRMREWLGDRQLKSLAEGDYTIVNRKFEATVSVRADDIKDDVLGIYSPMMEGLGQSAAELPDELVYSLLAAGFTTPCWDGQYFFDAEHPLNDDAGSLWSNLQLPPQGTAAGSPWILMDTKRPLKPLIYQPREEASFVAMTRPEDEQVFMQDQYRYGSAMRCNVGFGFPQMAFASTAPLTGANYSTLRATMTAQVSEEGHKLKIVPDTIVVGPSNRSAAKQLFQASIIVGGGDNIYFKDVEIIETPYLP